MMRTMIGLVVAVLVSSTPASASLAVTLATHDRLVLASDSRTWDPSCNCSGGDVARKVDIRDGYGFAMTGWPGAWEAWQATPTRFGESARDRARRVLDAVVAPDQVETFTILMMRRSDVYVARVSARRGQPYRLLQEATPTAPVAVLLGWDDGGAVKTAASDRLYAELSTTKPTEARMVTLARETLAAAAGQSPKVGGPSHVAVVDAAGGRWLTPPRVHWDGTNLTVSSGHFTVDANGVLITPGTGTWLSTDRGYAFDVGSEVLGTYGFTGSGVQSLLTQSWASATPTRVQAWAGYGGTATAPDNYAAIVQSATASAGNITLQTSVGGVLHAGIVGIGGTPNFGGATAGSAGSLAGYLLVQVGGVDYKLPIYNP